MISPPVSIFSKCPTTQPVDRRGSKPSRMMWSPLLRSVRVTLQLTEFVRLPGWKMLPLLLAGTGTEVQRLMGSSFCAIIWLSNEESMIRHL